VALGTVAAATTIAAGMNRVNAIRSQTYQGREHGGVVTGGTPYVVGEHGAEMFVPSQSGNILPNNRLGSGQPVNINFQIDSTDAEGFDELLMTRKNMIIGMVRQAMQTGRIPV